MNKLYLGDNLEIMRTMPDASVDLIATDPPFNTGKDWGAFDDRWEGGLKGYLKFMEERAVEMHRVLKDTGSLYLHCDPTASHYLKVMLDTVFGIKMFRNEIVWEYAMPSSSRNDFLRQHDIIFRYVYSKEFTFNRDSVRSQYSKSSLERKTYTNAYETKEDLKPDPRGKLCQDVWHDMPIGRMHGERLGYPTQKPVALYARMIRASSNEGDIVLDPFAGSGTTLDAAESLNRKWIGIEKNPDAIEVIEDRLYKRHPLFLEYEKVI